MPLESVEAGLRKLLCQLKTPVWEKVVNLSGHYGRVLFAHPGYGGAAWDYATIARVTEFRKGYPLMDATQIWISYEVQLSNRGISGNSTCLAAAVSVPFHCGRGSAVTSGPR